MVVVARDLLEAVPPQCVSHALQAMRTDPPGRPAARAASRQASQPQATVRWHVDMSSLPGMPRHITSTCTGLRTPHS